MKLSLISFCYHPTTVVLLDDNKEFLEMLGLTMSRYVPLSSYSSSQKALKYFNEEYKSISFIDQCFLRNKEENVDHIMQNIDIRSIHKEIYNQKRFDEIAVLVVDYAMPEINGLVFSRLLRQKYPRIKIIMLTGEADQFLAVEAFNEGIIDKFIMKSTLHVNEIILHSIRELERKFFMELSEAYMRGIKPHSSQLRCLSDPIFIEFFETLCKDNQIVEYYLMDEQGSFLLLDKQRNPSWLVVKNNQEMDGLYQFAEMEEAENSLIEGLKSKQFMPYFHTDQDLMTPPAEWQKYLHPAKQLNAKEIYYYAYINNSHIYDVQPEKIASYQQYLENL